MVMKLIKKGNTKGGEILQPMEVSINSGGICFGKKLKKFLSKGSDIEVFYDDENMLIGFKNGYNGEGYVWAKESKRGRVNRINTTKLVKRIKKGRYTAKIEKDFVILKVEFLYGKNVLNELIEGGQNENNV